MSAASDEVVDAELVDEPADAEVVDVDTSAERPDDGDEQPTQGAATVLPVRQQPSELMLLHDELRGVAQLAVTLAMAEVVPRPLREKPANVLAVILTGRELGVSPMTAIRMFHVIDGTVTVAPKVRLAMVRQQGLGRVWPDPENDATKATWYAERADTPGVVFRSTYTLEDAGNVKMTLWGGPSNNRQSREGSLLDKDNWKNYPARMLSWRALGYLLDDAFSEVGTGLYSPDEMGAVTDEDGEPILDVESAEVLVPQQGGRAGKRQQQAKPSAAETPASPEQIAELQARIEALSKHDGAREALLALWTATDESGTPRLPPLGKLTQAQLKIAEPMIKTVEKRVERGDTFDQDDAKPPTFGQEPSPDAAAATTAEPAPAAAERPLGFDLDGLPDGTSVEDDLQWLARAPEQLTDRVVERVKALTVSVLDEQLDAEGLPKSGKDALRRQRLAARLIRREMKQLAAVASTGG